MKKHFLTGVMMIIMMLMLSGCLGMNNSVTEKEIDLTAEYAAALLLKYDANYEPKLTTSIEVKEDPTLVEEEFEVLPVDEGDEEDADDKQEDTEDTSKEKKKDRAKDIPDGVTEVKLQEMYDYSDLSIRYKGYKECDTYPDKTEDSYFSLVAADGKKLVVVSFSVMNNSEEKVRFSQLDSKIFYRLNVDGDKYLKPSMTLLSNDIQYVNTEIGPKEAIETVAVFSVDEASDMGIASIVVYDESRQSVTTLR